MDRRRNDKKATEALALYREGYSLAQIAGQIGGSRQSIYDMLRIRGYVARHNAPAESQIFNGRKYSKRNNGYYLATSTPRTLMHRDVYVYWNREIKDGHDIHHIDHDRSNNKIENLESIEKGEHARRYATGRNQFSKGRK